MARPAAPGAIRVVATGTIDTNPWACVLHAITAATVAAEPDISVMSYWATLLDGAFAALAPHQSNMWTYAETVAVWMGVPAMLTATAATPSTGADSNDPAPIQTCALVNWVIGRHYRGGHPRSYLCGLTYDDVPAGRQLAVGYKGNIQSWANTWVAGTKTDPGTGAVWYPGNLHAREGFTNITEPSGREKAIPKYLDPPTYDRIVLADVNPVVATQKRRLAR